MKNLIAILFSVLSFNLTAFPIVYSGKVNPLRIKGTGPKSVEELVARLEANDSKLFLGGIPTEQWLEMVRKGANYGIGRVGFKELKTTEQALWMVQHAKVMATRDLPVSKGDYLSSGSLGKYLKWILNPAQPDSLLVFFAENGEFLILAKWDCLNPACDKRNSTPAPVEKKSAPPADTTKKFDDKLFTPDSPKADSTPSIRGKIGKKSITPVNRINGNNKIIANNKIVANNEVYPINRVRPHNTIRGNVPVFGNNSVVGNYTEKVVYQVDGNVCVCGKYHENTTCQIHGMYDIFGDNCVCGNGAEHDCHRGHCIPYVEYFDWYNLEGEHFTELRFWICE